MQGLQATKNKTKTSQDAQKTILFQSFFAYGNCRYSYQNTRKTWNIDFIVCQNLIGLYL